jgi:hypothetical protein
MNVTFDDPDDMELLADELDAIGVEWVRLAIAAEHREGTPDFSYFDAVVDIFRSRGIEVLGLLGGAEVSCAVHTDNAWACPPDPTLEREYATYIEEVVNHFDDRIDYWESWNGFLSGPYQRNVFVHADGSQTQLDFKSELLATEELFAEHYALGTSGGLGFWITEIGWGGHSKEGGERLDGFAMPSLARQARWLHQLLTLLRDDAQLHFVQAMFWWNATDITPDAGVPVDHFQYYGLLRPDLSRKPAADTFSELSPD